VISKKKLSVLAATGILAVSTAIGGATYALFSSSATNQGNSFSAGTLKIDSARDDIPMTGPMFYTESPSDVTGIGGLATGEWAPGDINTRGLFLRNTGSLDAKLTALKATPVKYAGKVDGKSVFTPVTSGDPQYKTDMDFANNATVTVWEVGIYDPTNDRVKPFDPDLSATAINNIMTSLNASYRYYESLHTNIPYTLTQMARILDGATFTGFRLDYGNAQMLQQINDLAKQNSVGSDTEDFKVMKMTKLPLKDLINNGSASAIPVTIARGGTSLLAYSVSFDIAAGNDVQGITPYFNFGSEWEQAKNN
jgi:spore coat-associated protein N